MTEIEIFMNDRWKQWRLGQSRQHAISEIRSCRYGSAYSFRLCYKGKVIKEGKQK